MAAPTERVWVSWLSPFDAEYIAAWWQGQGVGGEYFARPIWWTFGTRCNVIRRA